MGTRQYRNVQNGSTQFRTCLVKMSHIKKMIRLGRIQKANQIAIPCEAVVTGLRKHTFKHAEIPRDIAKYPVSRACLFARMTSLLPLSQYVGAYAVGHFDPRLYDTGTAKENGFICFSPCAESPARDGNRFVLRFPKQIPSITFVSSSCDRRVRFLSSFVHLFDTSASIRAAFQHNLSE